MSKNAKFMEKEYIMNHIIRDMNEWTKKTEFPSVGPRVSQIEVLMITNQGVKLLMVY